MRDTYESIKAYGKRRIIVESRTEWREYRLGDLTWSQSKSFVKQKYLELGTRYQHSFCIWSGGGGWEWYWASALTFFWLCCMPPQHVEPHRPSTLQPVAISMWHRNNTKWKMLWSKNTLNCIMLFYIFQIILTVAVIIPNNNKKNLYKVTPTEGGCKNVYKKMWAWQRAKSFSNCHRNSRLFKDGWKLL